MIEKILSNLSSSTRNKLKTISYSFSQVYFPLLAIISLSLIMYIYAKDVSAILLSIILNDSQRLIDINVLLSKFNMSHAFVLSVSIFYLAISFIRKINEERYYNSNGNVYYDHKYITFWLASRLLGFGKIQLCGVPLWLQYKIVLSSTFNDIKTDMWEQHYVEYEIENEQDRILVEYYPNIGKEESLNIVISDTYEIKHDSIGEQFVNNPTVHIKSPKCNSKIRYSNMFLVTSVRESVQKYMNPNSKVKSVYIFSTANSINNLNIIVSSFRFFGRLNSKKIYVVQYGEDMTYTKEYKVC